jgi:hypothetical protein
MKDASVGPCPACGGTGRIPDGEYTVFGARLNDAKDVALILQQLQLLSHEVRSGASTEDAKRSIDKKYRALSFLKKYLPQNATELAAYLALLGGTIAYCTKSTSDGAPQMLHVTVEVQQLLEQAIGVQRTNQPNSPPEKSKPADQETPKE